MKLVCLFAILPTLTPAAAVSAAPPRPAARPASPVDGRFFEERVRPVLLGRCLGCHGGPDAKAKLDLSTREAILKGSRIRAVVPPGSPPPGELIRRVTAGTMPPKGRLPAAEIEVLRQWVAGGLPWKGPRLDLSAASRSAGPDWWSLQPLRANPDLAPAGSVPQPDAAGPIDVLLARGLRGAGLGFSPPASREHWIRRVTFDLHGLPPAPEEIDAFARDGRPDAHERLVDRLLASPRFGERTARRWLDAVRFAESDGYEHDLPRPLAWPYRDWVIDAFNRDMPYDRFVREQIAGDALHPEDPKAGVPTGFLVAGGHDAVGAKVESQIMRSEVRQDELEDMIGTTTQVFLGMTAQCARCHDHKFDPIPQRDYYRLQAALSGAHHWGPTRKHEFYGVRSDTPAAVRLLLRGSLAEPGEELTPGALSALKPLPSDLGTARDPDPVRRLKLAAWITDARNPLFPRVIVNRVWSWVFGQGIVGTPNDFGFNGERPTHPELLDLLAQDFLAGGQSIKRLYRRLVLSRTYRQAAGEHAAAAARDAGNRLHWRHSPRRLESEELRDTILAMTGRLNSRMGGPGFQLFTWTNNAGALYRPVDPDEEDYCRRAIYRMVVRGMEDPLLASFDCPDPSNTTPRRPATTNAVQALSLLHNSFIDRQSGYFARRLERDAPGSIEDRIVLSYRLALGRAPLEPERARVAAFVRSRGLKAWCRVLFNMNEFLFLD